MASISLVFLLIALVVLSPRGVSPPMGGGRVNFESLGLAFERNAGAGVPEGGLNGATDEQEKERATG